MFSQNFQKQGNSLGTTLPLSCTSLARRTSRSQKQTRRSQAQAAKGIKQKEPQYRVRRMSELRLIELMERREKEVRTAARSHGEQKVRRNSGKEQYFNEFFQYFQEENQKPSQMSIKKSGFRPYRQMEQYQSKEATKGPTFREKSSRTVVVPKAKVPFKEMPINAMQGWETNQNQYYEPNWLEESLNWD